MTTTLGEALPAEISRCIDVLRVYDRTENGALAAELILAEIRAALDAIGTADILSMMLSYNRLKEVKL